MKQTTEGRLHRKKQYSRMVICNAFLQLLEKQPLNKITVKEVCQLADVNRTTFYSNFYDIYDVLEQIENELFEKINDSIKRAEYSNESLFDIFEIVEENTYLCRILFSINNAQNIIHKVMMIPYNHILNDWATKAGASNELLVYLFDYCVNGSVAFLRKWVTDEQKLPAKEAAKLLQDFINSNINQFVKA